MTGIGLLGQLKDTPVVFIVTVYVAGFNLQLPFPGNTQSTKECALY